MSIGYAFDDDVFDAELLVERTGLKSFSVKDLCAFFGASKQIVLRGKRYGHIPPPRWDVNPNVAQRWKEEHWACDQVVELLLGIMRRQGARGMHGMFDPEVFTLTQYECGTEAAYGAHRRRNEPIDDVCRKANSLRSAERILVKKRRDAGHFLASETTKAEG